MVYNSPRRTNPSNPAFRGHVCCARALVDRQLRSGGGSIADRLRQSIEQIERWAGSLSAPGVIRSSLDTYPEVQSDSFEKRRHRERAWIARSNVVFFFQKDRAPEFTETHAAMWQTAGLLCLPRIVLAAESKTDAASGREDGERGAIVVRYREPAVLAQSLAAANSLIVPAVLSARDASKNPRLDALALRYDQAVFLNRVTRRIGVNEACSGNRLGLTPMELVSVERIPESVMLLTQTQLQALKHVLGVPLPHELEALDRDFLDEPWRRWGLPDSAAGHCEPLRALHDHLTEKDDRGFCLNSRFLADEDIFQAMPAMGRLRNHRGDLELGESWSWRRFISESIRRELTWLPVV